jgi:Holliday junction resolvasome RuvABC endonuclease subunit
VSSKDELGEYGVFRPKGDDDERLRAIYYKAKELISSCDPEIVAIENQYLGFSKPKSYMKFDSNTALLTGKRDNFYSVHKLIMAAQCCACAAFELDVRTKLIQAKTWQKCLGIPGRSKREAVKRASRDMARAISKVEKMPMDACDAFNIARYVRDTEIDLYVET